MVFVIVNNYDGNFSRTNLFISKTLKKITQTYGGFEPLTNMVLEDNAIHNAIKNIESKEKFVIVYEDLAESYKFIIRFGQCPNSTI